MTLLRLSPRALSRSRFALSPMAETLGAMRVLANPCRDPWMAAWHERHAGAFRARLASDRFASGLVRLLTTAGWLPDFLTVPAPGGMRTTMAQELALARDFTDADIRAQLELADQQAETPTGLDWLSGSGWAARGADLMNALWHDHVLPDWPRRRALLEREVTYRAGLVAVYGWSNALGDMNRRSAWVGNDAIRFSNRPLATLLEVSLGTAGGHITVLRDAGLIEGTRVGRRVVYRRTDDGDRLAG